MGAIFGALNGLSGASMIASTPKSSLSKHENVYASREGELGFYQKGFHPSDVSRPEVDRFINCMGRAIQLFFMPGAGHNLSPSDAMLPYEMDDAMSFSSECGA